jgi:hypothetical protein
MVPRILQIFDFIRAAGKESSASFLKSTNEDHTPYACAPSLHRYHTCRQEGKHAHSVANVTLIVALRETFEKETGIRPF